MHRKHLPIVFWACDSELIMHNIVQPLTSAEFSKVERISSPEEEESGAGV